MPFPMGIMNVKVVKRYGALDLLTAAGRRGKGAERKKRILGKGKENIVEFTTVALDTMSFFSFLLLTFY